MTNTNTNTHEELNNSSKLSLNDAEKVEIYVLDNVTNFLGESPFYVHQTQTVYWVDILKGVLKSWQVSTGDIQTWDLKQPLGCAVPVRNSPNLVLISALKGIGLYDLKTRGWIHYYGNPEHERIQNRWNDGKCAPDGCFWVGSMNHSDTEAALSRGDRDGALYVLNGCIGRPKFHKCKDYVGISNGLAWSGDGTRMYYIDTPTQCVAEYAYEKHPQRPKIRRLRKDCIVIPKEDGAPDGCAMDIKDNLWIAMWGGGSVNQYSTKTGELLARIEIVDKYPTSLVWFGKDLERLFITTAQGDSLNKILERTEQPQKTPVRGRNYVIEFGETDIRGLPVASFDTGVFTDGTDRTDRTDRTDSTDSTDSTDTANTEEYT